MRNEEIVERGLGVKFKDIGLLHTALVHRSYLNESGETESNERLEFLGDAILEFITSAELYSKLPTLLEGELTAIRSRLVNTESLAEVGKKLSLGEYLYLSLGEEQGGGRKNPTLLANTFEAVIGAVFLDRGLEKCKELIIRLILTKIDEARSELKDPKSLLQELVQAEGKRAPIYKVIKAEGPDHAKVFTVGVFVEGEQRAIGAGKSKQEAQQEAAKKALKLLS